jgi:hypothetical protein
VAGLLAFSLRFISGGTGEVFRLSMPAKAGPLRFLKVTTTRVSSELLDRHYCAG